MRARSTIVDQLLTIDTTTGFSFENRRGFAMSAVLVDFLAARIDQHIAEGDLEPWSAGLAGRAEETLSGPLPAAIVRLLRAMETETAARDAIFGLVAHLLSEDLGAGFDALLAAAYDLLQVLTDDANLIPLGRVLASAFAPNVGDSVGTGAAISTTGSLTDQSVELLREVAIIDDADTLPTVLGASVLPRGISDPSTPLDTLLEVISEVNRVSPHEGTSYRAADHTALFEQIDDFLVDEERGIERLYDVVQTREGQ